jgi:anaerobic selenocysteine-containing dehydrogenase
VGLRAGQPHLDEDPELHDTSSVARASGTLIALLRGAETTAAEHRTFCRLCMAVCGVLVTVEGDQVVGVRGDPEHPLSRGYTCPKGRALGALHHHPDRLDRPMVRHDGRFLVSSWDDLLDDLATRVRGVVDTHGPSGVGMYLATGSAFDAAGRRVAERFLRALGSPQHYTATTIDTPCKPLVMELMAGHPGLVPLLDWERARFAVLVGTNPVVSHGHSNPFPDPVTRLRAVARRGGLWVLDPRRTETARLATRHIAPRPGTDYVLLAHAVRELLRDGADRRWLVEHTTGLQQLETAVEPFDTAYAVARCDVPADDVDSLVAAIRAHGAACAQTGTGVTMSAAANVTEWLAWALDIVTQSYDRPGAMWFNPGYLRRLDARTWTPGDGAAAPGPASRPDLPARFGEYPCAALVDEIEAGNLRALFVVGGNPMTAFPDADRTAAALAQLDVLAVSDVVGTETTARATHVLPAAGQLERADLPHYIDAHLPAVGTQYTPAVVPLGAERRPTWWPFAQLAARLGIDVLRGVDADVCTDDDILATMVGRGGASLDDLIAAGGPVVEEPIFGWVERVLPEGRWRIAPEPLVAQLADLAVRGTSDGAPIALIPRRQLRHLNSAMRDGGGPRQRHNDAVVLVNVDDAAGAGGAHGGQVRVTSESGTLVGPAHVMDDIRQGAVSVPHGYAAPNVSSLTTTRAHVDPLTGMVLQSGVGVSIAPAREDDADVVSGSRGSARDR